MAPSDLSLKTEQNMSRSVKSCFLVQNSDINVRLFFKQKFYDVWIRFTAFEPDFAQIAKNLVQMPPNPFKRGFADVIWRNCNVWTDLAVFEPDLAAFEPDPRKVRLWTSKQEMLIIMVRMWTYIERKTQLMCMVLYYFDVHFQRITLNLIKISVVLEQCSWLET